MKTETKIKLSPKQKEVIRLMREGWDCGIRGVDNGVQFKRVPANVHDSLVRLKLIKTIGTTIFNFELTELGKTIDIN